MEGREKAGSLFSKCIGEKARNVKLGHGSFITIDFGRDLLLEEEVRGKKRTYTQGEWHLWVVMCAWRLDEGDQPLIGSVDERGSIKEKIVCLENKSLKKVIMLNDAFDAVLQFEDQFQLRLFSNGVEDNKQWMLFTPERNTFTAGPGIRWSYEDSE